MTTAADRRGNGQLGLAELRLGQRLKETSVNNQFGVDSAHGNRSADSTIDINLIVATRNALGRSIALSLKSR